MSDGKQGGGWGEGACTKPRLYTCGFEMLCGICGGGILILRQRKLSKQCLLKFACLKIKIFTMCALKCFKDCNIGIKHGFSCNVFNNSR